MLLKKNNQEIIQRNQSNGDNQVSNSLLESQQISVIGSSKLWKCFHVQVFRFHIVGAVFPKSKDKDKEQKRPNCTKKPLLVVHFSELKVEFHTNLTLDTVPRKVFLQHVWKREDSEVVSNHSGKKYPVKRVEKFEIWISVFNKSSVGVYNKNTPEKGTDYQTFLKTKNVRDPNFDLEMSEFNILSIIW